MTERGKIIGDKWNALTVEEKQKLKEQHKKEVKEYEHKLNKYYSKHPDIQA